MVKALNEIAWFQRVRLLDGGVTPGAAPLADKPWHYLFDEIPFEGKSVLDIGCWDGGFCFMAEQRKATRVVGLDHYDVHGGKHDGWDFLHDHFQSKAEHVWGNVYDLPKEAFDVVLCYGVLYHLSDPLLAASNAFQAANEYAVFTANFFTDARPMLLYWESGEYRTEDTSNLCSLSTGFMDLVAKQNGFVRIDQKIRTRGPGKLGLHFLRSTASIKKDQGALLYKRVERTRPRYPESCLPLPILNLA
jgi:tRNA (mo5U34)-methyltransferase